MTKLLVKDICKEKGISLKVLAKKMGISPSALSQSLNNPSLLTLERIAKTLQVNIADLLGNDYPTIHGFVKTDKDVYTISSPEQWIETTNKIDDIAHVPMYFNLDDNRKVIKKFVTKQLENKSAHNDDAIMAYLGTSQIYCLSYDCENRKFTLTMCNQDGKIELQTYDILEFSGPGAAMDIDDLIFMINSDLENIYADEEFEEAL